MSHGSSGETAIVRLADQIYVAAANPRKANAFGREVGLVCHGDGVTEMGDRAHGPAQIRRRLVKSVTPEAIDCDGADRDANGIPLPLLITRPDHALFLERTCRVSAITAPSTLSSSATVDR